MANRRYDKAGTLAGGTGVNWTTADIKLAALKSTYAFDKTHEFVTALGANIVARSANLTGKVNLAGILKGDSALFALLTGATVQYCAVFIDTGVDATSSLLYYIDTAINLPTIPNGLDVTVQPDPSTGYLQV
jgi:hypothetical protein